MEGDREGRGEAESYRKHKTGPEPDPYDRLAADAVRQRAAVEAREEATGHERGHQPAREEADLRLVGGEAIMKNHKASVWKYVRQCYTVREHRKTQCHDRLARVGSVAGELVPLVVVDEDGRDVVVFLDEFELGWSRAAHGC